MRRQLDPTPRLIIAAIIVAMFSGMLWNEACHAIRRHQGLEADSYLSTSAPNTRQSTPTSDASAHRASPLRR